MGKTFTGWHMTAILVTFFAVVITVNVMLARFAIGTFGGTVVDNSYVASQQFNGWLNAAKRQEALGWTVRSSLDKTRHMTLSLSGRDGKPIDGALIRVEATHPLGRLSTDDLVFTNPGAGHYRSTAALPAGRWHLLIEVRHGRDVLRQVGSVQ